MNEELFKIYNKLDEISLETLKLIISSEKFSYYANAETGDIALVFDEDERKLLFEIDKAVIAVRKAIFDYINAAE